MTNVYGPCSPIYRVRSHTTVVSSCNPAGAQNWFGHTSSPLYARATNGPGTLDNNPVQMRRTLWYESVCTLGRRHLDFVQKDPGGTDGRPDSYSLPAPSFVWSRFRHVTNPAPTKSTCSGGVTTFHQSRSHTGVSSR